MDTTELGTANQLVNEASVLSQAIDIFYAEGSRITSFNIAAADGRNAAVDATAIAFPPEMLGMIEQALWTQYQSVTAQLDALGITGYSAPATGARAAIKRKR